MSVVGGFYFISFELANSWSQSDLRLVRMSLRRKRSVRALAAMRGPIAVTSMRPCQVTMTRCLLSLCKMVRMSPMRLKRTVATTTV